MLPSKKWENIERLIRLSAKICGADVGDRNFKFGFGTVLILFLAAMFFVWTFYSIYASFGDLSKVLEASCTIGKGVQGTVKLLRGLTCTEFYPQKFEFLHHLYMTYEAKGKNYEQTLHKCISRVYKFVQLMALIYVVGVPCVMLAPLFVWLYSGRRVLACGLILPGVDTSTTQGYAITLTLQLLVFTFGGFGNFAADIFFFALTAHFSFFVDIMRLKGEELNELADDPHNPKCLEAVLDVLKWHQMYTQFAEDAEHFFWVSFVQVASSVLAIVAILVIIINGEWYGAYGFICLEFTMMYAYCMMGTVVEVANDDFTTELYAIHWYKMRIPQQKMLQMMLMKSQSPKELTLGGIAPLSVNTGLQVTKMIYSFFMMLLNVFYD